MSDVSPPPRPGADGPVLGVDIGGVLVDRRFHDSDTSFFGDRPLDTPPVPGCFVALRRLVERFESRVHIVSKAGPRVAALSLDWLRHHGVFDYLPEDNVWFVARRQDKAYFVEELAVTHFVDDRLDVLGNLVTVPHRILFTGSDGDAATMKVPQWAYRCATWGHVVRHVETTLLRERS